MSTRLFLAMAMASVVAAVTLQEAINSENSTLSTLNGLLAAQPALLATLSSAQNITLLAPSNAAFDTLLSTPAGVSAAADPSVVANLLQYHVLTGKVPASGFTSTGQFLPTMLTSTVYTNVTGGQVVQGLVLDKKVVILSGLKEKSTVQTADVTFDGGVMHIIDTVLTIPLSPAFTAIDSNLTALAGGLTTSGIADTVNLLQDATIFAPSNAAFQAIGTATSALTTAQLSSILSYHVVSAATEGNAGSGPLYSSKLTNASVPTLQGESVTVLVEDSGKKVFVNSAKVVISDIIVSNGVMHVLDNVINPSNTTVVPDPAATTQAVAFAGAAKASTVPFTSGIVPSTTAPSASTSTAVAPPMRQATMGAAALFGVGLVGWVVL